MIRHIDRITLFECAPIFCQTRHRKDRALTKASKVAHAFDPNSSWP